MKTLVVMLNLVLVSFLAFNCSGTEYRTSGKDRILLASGEIHDGWYFAGSTQVDIDGTVNGDVFVAGGVVNVTGTVNGLLVAAGGQVNISGTVTDRIICAGGVIRLSGKTAKSLFAAGGTVIIERGATVGEYLLAGASEVQVGGVVTRDAKVGAGDLRVTGEIQGNLDAGVESFETEVGSRVGGNVTVTAKDTTRVRILPGTVLGQIHLKAGRETPAPRILGLTGGQIVFHILFFLSLCATALVLSFLFPHQLASVGTILNGRPGESVLVGLAGLILIPVAAIILFLTVIGIPLGLFLFMYLAWLAYLSQMAIGIYLGYRIFGYDGKRGWGLLGPVVLGTLIVHLCAFIPFVNVVVFLGGLILGVGALLLVTQEQFMTLRSR